MKLNHECVRDVLLYLEENLLTKPLKIKEIAIHFKDTYLLDDIVYTVQKLSEANFISVLSEGTCNKHSMVKDITWKGHNFLDNIRDNKVVAKVKQSLSKIKSFSIEVLAELSKEMVKSFVLKS